MNTFCARAATRTVVVGKSVSSSSGGRTSRSTTTSSSPSSRFFFNGSPPSPSSPSSSTSSLSSSSSSCVSASAIWVRARGISSSFPLSRKGSTLRRFSTAAARTSTSGNGEEESETRKNSSQKIAPTILQNRLVRPERFAVQRNFSSSGAAAPPPPPSPTNSTEDKNGQTTQTPCQGRRKFSNLARRMETKFKCMFAV